MNVLSATHSIIRRGCIALTAAPFRRCIHCQARQSLRELHCQATTNMRQQRRKVVREPFNIMHRESICGRCRQIITPTSRQKNSLLRLNILAGYFYLTLSQSYFFDCEATMPGLIRATASSIDTFALVAQLRTTTRNAFCTSSGQVFSTNSATGSEASL